MLAVINNPKPTITPNGPTTFCAGGSVTLVANTFAGVAYQWQKNSVNIVGATNQNYVATSTGQYRVIETANGCSKTATAVQVTVNCRAGEGAVSNDDEIKFMPNPFNNELTVYGFEFVQGDKIQMMNVLGEVVLSESVLVSSSNLKLQTSNLSSGIYFMQITTPSAKKTWKVVKQ